MRKNQIFKELKSEGANYCLYGTCKFCTRIVDGRGIHDYQIFDVYELLEDVKCDHCDFGTVTEDCPCCEMGDVQVRCKVCDGTGKLPDEYGEKRLIKEEIVMKVKL